MLRILSSNWPDFFANQRIKGFGEKVNETQVSKAVRPPKGASTGEMDNGHYPTSYIIGVELYLLSPEQRKLEEYTQNDSH